MKLNFLGNGSGFSSTHTGAYFIYDNDLIIIDCSMLNLHKILALNPTKFNNIYLLITHMHDDHVSGMGLFAQYLYYIYNKNTFTIISPSYELKHIIEKEFKIKGISENLYKLETVGDNYYEWLVDSILTSHVPELEGQCYGYDLIVDGVNVVYSGDTNTLDPYLNYLISGSEFYVDVSANYGNVHLKYDDVAKKLNELVYNNIDIYIMHIDNEKDIREKIKGTKINIAEIF